MRAAMFSAALSTALLSASGATAQSVGVFDKWLSQDSPQCVPVSEFKSVSTVTDLSPAQFQFVRALYVALPPVSRTLPPGDHAVMAIAGTSVMLALVDGVQACARFLAPGLHPVDAESGRRGPVRTCRPARELASLARLNGKRSGRDRRCGARD